MVKIDCQEMAALVRKHWVNPHHEVTFAIVFSREVPANYLVCHREKVTIRAVCTLNPGFFANAA